MMNTHTLTEISLKTIKSVDPYKMTKEKCAGIKPGKKNFLVSFGKASLGMAKAISEIFEIEAGVVSTNENDLPSSEKIEYFHASHPFPDIQSVNAAMRAIEIIQSATREDLVIFAISGGGSALFEYPKVDLELLNEITKKLMSSGADIQELNTVRKALSKIKGGKLAGFTKARAVSFVISDVIGDDLSMIASGPTYHQEVNTNDAVDVLKKYGITIPKLGECHEPVPRTDVKHVIVASNKDACMNAVKLLKDDGYESVYLGSAIQGEAREVAKVLGGIYTEIEKGNTYFKPIAVVSGGETTVTVKGNGIGGRNQELALAMIDILRGKHITFASFGTDGIDGNSPADGAVIDGQTFDMAKSLGLDPKEYLRRNDSFTFLDKLGLSLITGPTGTNVMDVQIAVIE